MNALKVGTLRSFSEGRLASAGSRLPAPASEANGGQAAGRSPAVSLEVPRALPVGASHSKKLHKIKAP